MKTFPLLLLACIILLCNTGYAQQDIVKVKSIEEAINTTLKKFRERISDKNAIVYCVVKNQLDIKKSGFDEKNLLVENGINPKYVDNKTTKYLLTFIVSQNREGTTVDISMSSLVKKARRKIEYTVHSYAIPIHYQIMPD